MAIFGRVRFAFGSLGSPRNVGDVHIYSEMEMNAEDRRLVITTRLRVLAIASANVHALSCGLLTLGEKVKVELVC